MMGIKSTQERMFYNFSLSSRIPEDHILRKVNQTIDLRFVRDLVADKYSHTGQPSIDPEVLFRMMLIGYLYGITSERRLAQDISLNMGYMWFIGYDLDEPTPNHSVLSKARSRYGKEVFEQFFKRVLEQCVKAGLVKGDKVYMDSTYIQANASRKSIIPRTDAIEPSMNSKEFVEKVFAENPVEADKPEEKAKEQKPPDNVNNTGSKETKDMRDYSRLSNKTHYSKTDPECSIVSRKETIDMKLAYKEHFTVDEHKRVITAVKVTPGAIGDEALLSTLIKEQPCPVKEVCADSKYGTAENFKYLQSQGIQPTIPPWLGCGVQIPGRISKHEFVYDSKTDAYTCPSGKTLSRGKNPKSYPILTKYLSHKEDCLECTLSNRCLIPDKRYKRNRKTFYRHMDDIYKEQAAERLLTEDGKRTMSKRKSYAEWVNAESKTKHGMRKAMFRGLTQTTIQVLMTASVQNLKRLMSQIPTPTTIFKELYYFMSVLVKNLAFA